MFGARGNVPKVYHGQRFHYECYFHLRRANPLLIHNHDAKRCHISMCQLQLRAKGDLCSGRYIHFYAFPIANVCRLQRVFRLNHHIHHACTFRQLSFDRNCRLLDAFDYRNGFKSRFP